MAFISNLFISTVNYRVEIYTPDGHVNSEYRLTVRIKGQGGQKTAENVLHGARQVQQGYDMSLLCTAEYMVGGGRVYKNDGAVVVSLGE